jgi:hypothetical protein
MFTSDGNDAIPPKGVRVVEVGRTPHAFDPRSPRGKLLPDAGEVGDYLMALQKTDSETGKVEQTFRDLDRDEITETVVMKGKQVSFSPSGSEERHRYVVIPGNVKSVAQLR